VLHQKKEERSLASAYFLWKRKSLRKMSLYKVAVVLAKVTQSIIVTRNRLNIQNGLREVELQAHRNHKHGQKAAGLRKKFKALQLERCFEVLRRHKNQQFNMKLGLKLLAERLSKLPLIKITFKMVLAVAKRRRKTVQLCTSIADWCGRVFKERGLKALGDRCREERRLEAISKSIEGLVKQDGLKRSVRAWRAIIQRKALADKKGKLLEDLVDLRTANKIFSLWSSAVLANEDSLYSREKLLTRSINKLHIINAIGRMIGSFSSPDIARMKKDRKFEIVERLYLIESILDFKLRDLQLDFFPKLLEHVKFKDDLEVRVESLERVFVRLTLRKLKDRVTEDKLQQSIVEQFRERSSKRALQQL